MTVNRRSLISGAIGGAAGVVVGRELVPSSVGAAADVDRSEFEALAARVAYLEQFHPPMGPPPHVPTFSGEMSLPDGFVVPFGEVWDFDPDVSTTVEVAANVVVAGTLRMRPASPGVVHTLRFVGINEANYVGGGMEPLASDVGLWAVGAGVLDLAGSAKTGWTRATHVDAASNTVNLVAAPLGWQVGDTVTIAPTSGPGHFTRYDTRTIADIAGTVLTLSAPTTWAHPLIEVEPGYAFGAEVMNLTRNVVIEGTATGRAHVFVNSSSPHTIDSVELRHLGPRKANANPAHTDPVLGRYALHLHMCGDGSRGTTVTNTVAHTLGNLAFVPHLSNGITFAGCVAHDLFESAYWWDIGDRSDDITYQSCVASWIRSSPEFRGYSLSGFTLGDGAGNRMFDCTVIGSQGNSDASAIAWPEGAADAWEVRRIIAHNCRRHGLGVWQNNGVPHLVQDFISARNGGSGINHGAYRNSYEYANGWLYANTQASVNLHALAVASDPLRFRELRMDAAGLHLSPVTLPNHNLPSAQPVQFQGCEFVGHTGTTFRSTAATMANPDVIDVAESGPVTMTWNVYSHPSSVIRVESAGVAEQITPAGSTPIAAFSSHVTTPRVPFAILASA